MTVAVSREEMLACATTFTIATRPRLKGETGCPIDIQITRRAKRAGQDSWAVVSVDDVWDIEAQCWVGEPQPSSRDEDFLRRTRFLSLYEAFATALAQRDRASELGNKAYQAEMDERAAKAGLHDT
jgi:hypothetical protein